MAYDLKKIEQHIKEVAEWLGKEFTSIRTGRATPTLLDSIQVESYGARVPLQQVGSVTVEDARTLRITPWDPEGVKAIEKGIIDANLGISVNTDEKGLRVVFPELTSERREQLMRLAKAKLEDARVSLRSARDEAVKDIDAQHKSGDMSEDEKFRAKEALQKKIDEANKTLNEMIERKEKEINQ